MGKIAIIGAQGVGKTTLYNGLKKRFSLSHTFLPSPSTYLWDDIKDLPEDRKHIALIVQSFKTHLNHLDDKATIQDRSLVDCYVYGVLMGLPDIINRTAKGLATLAASQLDKVFYIPAEFEAAEDGKRTVETQRLAVEVFEEYLSDLRTETDLVTLSGSRGERLEEAIKGIL